MARLLADTETLTAIQFSDSGFDEIRIALYTYKVRQNTVRLFPKADASAVYRLPDGSEMSGSELMRDGVEVSKPQNGAAYFITLTRVPEKE